MATQTEVLVPTSAEEAASAFADGAGITVVAGGTIVMPEIQFGRLRPQRALFLGRAGFDRIESSNGTYRIGATVPVAALVGEAPEPLASFAANVGDYEIRSQGTIGGNLCAPPGATVARGDLQAPLLALNARVRSAGAGGERTDSIDDFLAAGPDGRLVIELEVEEPKRAAMARLRRPHAHHFTALAVAVAETSDGIGVAIAGAGPRAVRAASVEQALAGGASPEDAAARAVEDVEPQDDAIASAAYRRRVLPNLVAHALGDLSSAKGDR